MQLDNEDQLENSEDNVIGSSVFGVPSTDEKLKSKILAQKAKKAEQSAVEAKKKDLKEQFEKFSKSLTEEDFDNSVKAKNNLIENEGLSADSLEKIKINTVEIYKKQFSFPEVAKNDFSSGLLEELEIS